MPKLHNFKDRQLAVILAGLQSLDDMIDCSLVARSDQITHREVNQLRVLLNRAVTPVSPKPPRKPSKCPECGDKDKLFFVPDPYSCDVRGDDTPRWMCKRCIDKSSAEI